METMSYDMLEEVPQDVMWAEIDDMGEHDWRVIYPDRDAAAIPDMLSYLEGHDELDSDVWRRRESDGAWEWFYNDHHEETESGWTTIMGAAYGSAWGDVEEDLRELFETTAVDHSEDFEPMMDYAYPLPPNIDAAELQAELMKTCVCVVSLEGEPVLALQGGGMDLSWEIVEAYITAGCLPPVHFAKDLPRMGGRGGKDDAWTLNACFDSLANMAARSEGRFRRFQSMYLKGESK